MLCLIKKKYFRIFQIKDFIKILKKLTSFFSLYKKLFDNVKIITIYQQNI